MIFFQPIDAHISSQTMLGKSFAKGIFWKRKKGEIFVTPLPATRKYFVKLFLHVKVIVKSIKGAGDNFKRQL